VVQRREVWAAHEADIDIYEELADGNIGESPMGVYYYGQGVEITETDEVEPQEEPGRDEASLHSRPGSVTCDTKEFYYSNTSQFMPFADRTKSYRVFVRLVNAQYDGVAQKNDLVTLYGAKRSERSFSVPENNILERNLKLSAERVVFGNS
jgi:hypothetical protein